MDGELPHRLRELERVWHPMEDAEKKNTYSVLNAKYYTNFKYQIITAKCVSRFMQAEGETKFAYL